MAKTQNLATIDRHLTALLNRMVDNDFSTGPEDLALSAAINSILPDYRYLLKFVDQVAHLTIGQDIPSPSYESLARIVKEAQAISGKELIR